MSDNPQAMIIHQPETLLGPFGSRKEVRELADRILRSITIKLAKGNTRPLTMPESLYIAQAALSAGLDPFTGDVQPMLDTSGNFVLYYSPTAYQKTGARQIDHEGGGAFWAEYEPILEANERMSEGIPIGAIAFRCKLFDSVTLRAWQDTIEKLRAVPGITWNEVKAEAGPRPCTFGIGFYQTSDSTKYSDAKWSPAERARKRAFKAAMKKRFVLNFSGESDGDLPDEFTGKLMEREPEPTTIPGEATEKKKAPEGMWPEGA